MLAAPRVDRLAAWELENRPASAASSPGEDLPPFPLIMGELDRIATSSENTPLQQTIERRLAKPVGLSRTSGTMGSSGIGMERQASGSGTVAGVEWVDWYDCYKRYKDAKIRAESGAEITQPGMARIARQAVSPLVADSEKLSRREEILPLTLDASSVITLTPTTSRDDNIASEGGTRKRGASIRSSIDLIPSPNQKRPNAFDRPRQTSGSSSRSAEVPSLSGQSKKKNLVNKMEGWWNAVKSNFIPEIQHQPQRPSNLGNYVAHRVPSAPQSRRGSDMSPITTPQAALFPPQPMRRDSSQSLRQATSHAELRSRSKQYDSYILQGVAGIAGSTSADLARLSRGLSSSLAPNQSQNPSTMLTDGQEAFIQALNHQASGLDARRGHASLRLELEPNRMSRAGSRMTESSGSAGRSSHHSAQTRTAVAAWPSQASSRTSSYGHPLADSGLTSELLKWDQTPSPIFAPGTQTHSAKEDRPVAPGAEISVASVRQHVRHRLNAAKDACNYTLQKAIAAITKFAEEQRIAEQEDVPLDYFEAMSDSPTMDAEDSGSETGDKITDSMRSRAGAFCSLRDKRLTSEFSIFFVPTLESKTVGLSAS